MWRHLASAFHPGDVILSPSALFRINSVKGDVPLGCLVGALHRSAMAIEVNRLYLFPSRGRGTRDDIAVPGAVGNLAGV
jgi:hypothetical protein